MRKYRVKKADLDMNLAPLIDVVFLLLIFFMVASTLNINEVQATIELPGTNTVEGKSIEKIVLYITREGQLFLEKEKIGWEQLSNTLYDLMIKNETREVTVYADKEVEFQYIVNMLDLANELKINQIQFTLHHQ
ncbi:MAG: biopolymer transporter ExbD [Atribacterota bacterium]|nr:biopolymer transporter ExbD [Atribacterota bacterium]